MIGWWHSPLLRFALKILRDPSLKPMNHLLFIKRASQRITKQNNKSEHEPCPCPYPTRHRMSNAEVSGLMRFLCLSGVHFPRCGFAFSHHQRPSQCVSQDSFFFFFCMCKQQMKRTVILRIWYPTDPPMACCVEIFAVLISRTLLNIFPVSNC